jgi:hypothetical protein
VSPIWHLARWGNLTTRRSIHRHSHFGAGLEARSGSKLHLAQLVAGFDSLAPASSRGGITLSLVRLNAAVGFLYFDFPLVFCHVAMIDFFRYFETLRSKVSVVR